jgi:hypothetical protein
LLADHPEIEVETVVVRRLASIVVGPGFVLSEEAERGMIAVTVQIGNIGTKPSRHGRRPTGPTFAVRQSMQSFIPCVRTTVLSADLPEGHSG